MATLEQQLQATAPTPGRNTRVQFDIPETVPQEAPFVLSRTGTEMQPLTTTDAQRRTSGVWTLRPINGIGGRSTETTQFDAGIIRASSLTLATGWQEVSQIRSLTELPGITAGANVIAQGGWVHEKRVVAGATWNTSLTAVPNLFGVDLNYEMDRIITKPGADYDSDTGYRLRVTLRGAALTNPDFLFGFQFGGPVIMVGPSTGYGEFYIAFSGDGQAFLYEYIDAAWREVGRWRWGAPKEVPGLTFDVQILPHAPRFLEILTITGAVMPNPLAQTFLTASIAYKAARGDQGANPYFLHEVKNRSLAVGYSGNVLRSVTGPGKIAFDLRRDLLASVQLNRLIYPATGTIVDRPFTLPYGYADAHIARPTLYVYQFQRDLGNPGSVVTTANITLEQYNGSGMTVANEAITWRGTSTTVPGYVPVGGLNRIRARITLGNTESAPRTHTPSVVAYNVFREGHNGVLTPGIKTGGKLQSFSMTGAGYDPEQETANLRIEDETNALGFLRLRGAASVRVDTPYDPAHPERRCILHEGYIGRVRSRRKGKTGEVYPSPLWHALDIDCLGKWDRFSQRFFYQRMNFGLEDGMPYSLNTTTKLPSKVTDVIRYCLTLGGYGDSQLDIPDEDMRIFISKDNAVENLSVPPGTPIWEFAVNLARDYLNAALIWDANARPEGATSQGMWRLLRPPTGTERPLWNFVTTAPTGAGVRLPHLPRAYGPPDAAYGPNTSPIYELEYTPVKPEGNVLTVSGAAVSDGQGGRTQIRRTLVNPKSWNAPTHASADDTDLDYLGWIKPLEYIDVTLGSASEPAIARLQVDFIARRIFELACRGQLWVEFTSTFAFVNAAAAEPTKYTNPTYPVRPLRAGDMITIDGTRYIMHSVNPVYEKDTVQQAHYEAQLFRPFRTWQ